MCVEFPELTPEWWWVRSSTVTKLIPEGSDALSEGNAALMRSTVSMMFAPGWRRMMSGMARLAVQEPRGANVFNGILNVR